MNTSAHWFDQAKPGRFEGLNAPLGKRGRLAFVVLGMLLIPVVAGAAWGVSLFGVTITSETAAAPAAQVNAFLAAIVVNDGGGLGLTCSSGGTLGLPPTGNLVLNLGEAPSGQADPGDRCTFKWTIGITSAGSANMFIGQMALDPAAAAAGLSLVAGTQSPVCGSEVSGDVTLAIDAELDTNATPATSYSFPVGCQALAILTLQLVDMAERDRWTRVTRVFLQPRLQILYLPISIINQNLMPINAVHTSANDRAQSTKPC